MKKRALIVTAQAPSFFGDPGNLQETLSAEDGAALREAILVDALERYDVLEADIRLCVPADRSTSVDVPDHVRIMRRETPLSGKSIFGAAMETFAAGFGGVCIVGECFATVPADFLAAAFDALETPLSVALGPVENGGLYAVALNDLFPELFEGRSASEMFPTLLERAASVAESVTVLPPWHAVDGAHGIRRLAEELSDDPDTHAPRTRAWFDAASRRDGGLV